MRLKSCNRCKVEKPLEAFHACPSNKDGLQYNCIDCRKTNRKEKADQYRETSRKYDQKNRERIYSQRAARKEANPEKSLAYHQKYYQKNKSEYKAYYEANKQEINKKKTARDKYRKQIEINYKIAKNLRTRMYIAVRDDQKSGSAVKDLGCTIEEFKLHIQIQWTEDMTWDNYGEWHLDHIKPLVSFNLSNRDEFLIAANFLNYQPLWAKDNLSKGSK